MFVITADQVNSRATADIVGKTLIRLNRQFGGAIIIPADRTAGDELQLLVATGADALRVALELTRDGQESIGQWSVGCGVGAVDQPLPTSIREASGGAFVAARAAVDRAKKRPTRFAVEHESQETEAADVEAFLDLLLIIRSRRTPEGWELYDLTEDNLTQAEAAARLGISPQAASKRAQAAELRAERAAVEPIARAMERLGSLKSRDKGV